MHRSAVRMLVFTAMALLVNSCGDQCSGVASCIPDVAVVLPVSALPEGGPEGVLWMCYRRHSVGCTAENLLNGRRLSGPGRLVEAEGLARLRGGRQGMKLTKDGQPRSFAAHPRCRTPFGEMGASG
jgi:hypothetical protein